MGVCQKVKLWEEKEQHENFYWVLISPIRSIGRIIKVDLHSVQDLYRLGSGKGQLTSQHTPHILDTLKTKVKFLACALVCNKQIWGGLLQQRQGN